MCRIIILSILVANLFSCVHIPCKSTLFEEIKTGINYEKICTKSGQTAHIATVDPAYARLKLIRAQGEPGLQTVSVLAQNNNAPIAINGGFFKADGKPVGALKIDGEWINKPANNRGLLGWTTRDNTLEFIFDRAIQSQDIMKSVFYSEPWWENAENVIGGAPLLIKNGEKISVKEEKTLEDFLTNRYARTALCVDKNNFVKLVVIDGGDRKTHGLGLISGMSIDELSDFLLSLGCQGALNLDGGYSSTFLKNGVKVNSYAFTSMPQRFVSDAILVVPK